MISLFVITASLVLFLLVDSQMIEVQLNANWDNPPFQLGLLETLASENEDLYLTTFAEIASFAIIDPLDEDEEIEPGFWFTDTDLYENVFGSFSSEDIEQFDDAFASKNHLSRIISHYKHYDEVVLPMLEAELIKKCGTTTESWVQFNEAIYCKPDDIYALMSDNNSCQDRMLPFDRVIGEYGPLLVFYANVNDAKFKQFASNLYDNSRFGKNRFVMRYIPQYVNI